MNFVKHIEYKPNMQVWRIIITDDEKVILEKRDALDKQVYFDAFELKTKDETFSNLQLEEKFWIGIEKVYKGIIFFHKYTKPDMPDHKDIIAYDINSKKILWSNEDYSFLFLYDDKVYCFKQQFEGRNFYTLDYKTGELIKDLGSQASTINKIYDESRNAEDYSDYAFPETFPPEDKKVKLLMDSLISKFAIVGKVEYNILDHFLFASYHTQSSDDCMINTFSVINIETEQEIFSENLSPNTKVFMTDSFFVFKDYLFLLKGKEEVEIYKIT